jgi:hypothetical protein
MASKRRIWGFTTAQRDLLLGVTLDLHAPLFTPLICSQRRSPEEDLWVMESNVRELNEVYDLVESLLSQERGRKRRELLEGMRASLCSAMDRY